MQRGAGADVFELLSCSGKGPSRLQHPGHVHRGCPASALPQVSDASRRVNPSPPLRSQCLSSRPCTVKAPCLALGPWDQSPILHRAHGVSLLAPRPQLTGSRWDLGAFAMGNPSAWVKKKRHFGWNRFGLPWRAKRRVIGVPAAEDGTAWTARGWEGGIWVFQPREEICLLSQAFPRVHQPGRDTLPGTGMNAGFTGWESS